MSQEASRGERRILVVINQSVDGATLRGAIGDDSVGARVRLVAPAFERVQRTGPATRIGARAAAQRRLNRCLAELDTAGVEAAGAVGDAEPLRAIEESLRTFAADEIVIAFNPARGRRRLGRDFPARVVDSFGLPVLQLTRGRPLAA